MWLTELTNPYLGKNLGDLLVEEQRINVIGLFSVIPRIIGMTLNFPNPYLVHVPARNRIVPIMDYIEEIDLVKGIITYTKKGMSHGNQIYLDFTNTGFSLSIGRYIKTTMYFLKSNDHVITSTSDGWTASNSTTITYKKVYQRYFMT